MAGICRCSPAPHRSSDVAGVETFEFALRRLGLVAETHGPIVVVKVHVPVGPFAGSSVPTGTHPPPDFPRVPPHWLHLLENVTLPGGGKNASELGAGWAKWSRPHKRWHGGESAASQWLAQVRALLSVAGT
jgi:hypothetical protein